LGSTNRGFLCTNRELLRSTILPSATKGRITDHHILAVGIVAISSSRLAQWISMAPVLPKSWVRCHQANLQR